MRGRGLAGMENTDSFCREGSGLLLSVGVEAVTTFL